MFQKPKIRYFLFHLLAFFIFQFGKSLSADFIQDTSLQNESKVEFGSEKIVNTYLFKGDANFLINTLYGNFLFNQIYRGTAIQSGAVTFRDDQNFNLKYYLPLNNFLSVAAIQNWLLSSDSRNIEINKLERINGAAGLRFDYLDNSNTEVYGGIESYNQVGILSKGPFFRVNSLLDNLNLDNYIFNYELMAEYVELNYDRKNTDFDFNSSMFGTFDENSALNINLRYKTFGRDFFSTINSENGSELSIEERNENRLNSNLNLNFDLLDLPSSILINVNNVTVNRSFKGYLPDIPLTGVERESNELNLMIALNTSYNSTVFNQDLSIFFDLRNEENTIRNLFGINKEDEDKLRGQENQRDNIASRTRLTSMTKLLLSRLDTLSAGFMFSHLMYDTPSSKNYDDRDEISIIGRIKYSKQISSILRGDIFFEIQMNHLVFIKSKRSALNNWNRVFRLRPEFELKTDLLYMKPEIEVLANYTVYDFEDISPGIKSFSFRQLSYRDSIALLLSNKWSCQADLKVRYFERGLLYWDQFAETPQSSNSEQLIRLFIVNQFSKNGILGLGCRYYFLNQKSLSRLPGTNTSGDIGHSSIGPEVYFILEINERTRFFLQGWYEFQYINKMFSKEFPNFILYTTINL